MATTCPRALFANYAGLGHNRNGISFLISRGAGSAVQQNGGDEVADESGSRVKAMIRHRSREGKQNDVGYRFKTFP